MPGYDVIGNIAILKFPEKTENIKKKKIAFELLKKQKNIKTVLEKVDKVKGRLRTIKTRFLAGKNTRETIHKESGCLFKLDVEKCYFSPRLSGERAEIVKKIKSKDKVLVMFSGIAPFSIVIAKLSGARKIVSIELGEFCCKYARENILLNKTNNVEIIQGDVKKVVSKLKEKFDKIVMPRPQLKETFLKQAFSVSKKGTIIFYYDFGKEEKEILEKIGKEAGKYKKRIKILGIKKAGDIAPYKYRFRVDFKIN